MTPFPAPPGTYLLDRKPGEATARKIPVVGFAFVQEGPVYPLCAIATGGLTLGRVLVTPDGLVTDPAAGVVCGSVDEWMKLSGSDGYWKAADPAPAPKAAATPKAPAAPAAATGAPISFGTKTFKTNSYWRLKSEDVDHPDSLFQIEGDQPYPDDKRCEKITRDEYAALKKSGAPVIDPHAAPDEEEDDDGMDLV
jgi:hypothetical protein